MRQTDRQTDERIAALRDAICWAGHKIQLPIGLRVFFDDIMTITCSAAMILLCYALSRFELLNVFHWRDIIICTVVTCMSNAQREDASISGQQACARCFLRLFDGVEFAKALIRQHATRTPMLARVLIIDYLQAYDIQVRTESWCSCAEQAILPKAGPAPTSRPTVTVLRSNCNTSS